MREKKQYHSIPYHRYFEGYAEREVEEPDGRLRIERIYIGKYYIQNLSDHRRYLQKVLYSLLYMLACALYIHAGTRNTDVNVSLYVSVFTAVSMLMLFGLSLPVLYYLTAPRKMVVRVYRDASQNLIRFSFFACMVLFITALASLICTVAAMDSLVLSDFICAAEYFGAGAILFLMRKLEMDLSYDEVSSGNECPEDGVAI